LDDGCHSVPLGEQVAMFLGLLDPEDGGTVILGNIRNSSISDVFVTSQNTIIFEFYASLYMVLLL
jgi:hypothetical protein